MSILTYFIKINLTSNIILNPEKQPRDNSSKTMLSKLKISRRLPILSIQILNKSNRTFRLEKAARSRSSHIVQLIRSQKSLNPSQDRCLFQPHQKMFFRQFPYANCTVFQFSHTTSVSNVHHTYYAKRALNLTIQSIWSSRFNLSLKQSKWQNNFW